MGNSTQRRERRLADELRALSLSDPQHFQHVWRAHLNGWCAEIIARGREVRRGPEADQSRRRATLSDLYALVDKAERLLQALGPELEGRVGAEARTVLQHECAKAVARATDPSIYRFETDTVHRLMQSRPQTRSRG